MCLLCLLCLFQQYLIFIFISSNCHGPSDENLIKNPKPCLPFLEMRFDLVVDFFFIHVCVTL